MFSYWGVFFFFCCAALEKKTTMLYIREDGYWILDEAERRDKALLTLDYCNIYIFFSFKNVCLGGWATWEKHRFGFVNMHFLFFLLFTLQTHTFCRQWRNTVNHFWLVLCQNWRCFCFSPLLSGYSLELNKYILVKNNRNASYCCPIPPHQDYIQLSTPTWPLFIM